METKTLMDEAEKTAIVVCRQRAYTVPADVAHELAAQAERIVELERQLLSISGAESIEEALDIFQRERAANVDLATERLRFEEGLRWYADGHHYDLPGWDDCSGETTNWLFPPNAKPWMVDNGGVARSILDGKSINPNHAEDDNITIDAALNTGDHV